MRAAAVACALLTSAVAVAAPRTLVLEAVVGRDHSDVHAYLGDVVAALGQPLADHALADAIDAHFGAPPPRLSAGALAELAARARQAERNLFFNGSHVRESIDELEATRARLGDAQATLAHDHEARLLYQHVLLKLARAYQVNPGPESPQLATARMQELVRNLPDLPVDAALNEPELVRLHEQVRAALAAPAQLTVTLPPGARAFCEGQELSAARPSYAGDYRVFASNAAGDGRLHRVTIARDDVELAIDADFESALHSEGFVGFVYASPTARAVDELRWIGQLGRALAVDRVYVLAADGADGRPGVGVWGYSVDAHGAWLVASSKARGAAGRAAPAEVAHAAERVAAAFDGGAPAPGVTVMAGRSAPPSLTATTPGRPAPSASERGLTIAGWTTLAVGLPLAVTGAALWPRSSFRAGAPLVGIGASFAVTGTVWTLGAEPGRPRTRNLAIVSALWVAAAIASGILASR